MPLNDSVTYRKQLAKLPSGVADLVSDIASILRLDNQSSSSRDLENVLFAHADAIRDKVPSCAARLKFWLQNLAEKNVQASDRECISAIVVKAAELGGSSSMLMSDINTQHGHVKISRSPE